GDNAYRRTPLVRPCLCWLREGRQDIQVSPLLPHHNPYFTASFPSIHILLRTAIPSFVGNTSPSAKHNPLYYCFPRNIPLLLFPIVNVHLQLDLSLYLFCLPPLH